MRHWRDGVKGGVLIADGNTARSERLAAACEAAGVVCRTGPHGAAALEMALADNPSLVVAQLDLPLVDAVKLAEILRANPRTSRSPFLFLGEEQGETRPGRPGDLLLPNGAEPNDVVGVIEGLILRQDRLDAVDEAVSNSEIVAGELELVSLSDVITTLQIHRSSGRLDLRREPGAVGGGDAETGLVWIRMR